jgi:polyphosphate kinase
MTASSPAKPEASPKKRSVRRLRGWPKDRFVNRELSWLDFNARVLALAAQEELPLLERAKFLAIFASNMDEFFMVRVAGLKRQLAAGMAAATSADGMSVQQQHQLVLARAGEMSLQHGQLFAGGVLQRLADAGVRVVRRDDLSDRQRKTLHRMFVDRIFPVLTPLAVDPGHPFPYISNQSLNLAVILEDPDAGRRHFARVKVPPLLGRFLSPEPGVHVPLEDVIADNLKRLFPGMRIIEHHVFRVIRDADLEVDDDGAEDLLEALEEELTRRRISPAVRLEVEEGIPGHILALLRRELQLAEGDVIRLPGMLDLSALWELHALDRPELKVAPFQPLTPAAIETGEDGLPDVFAAARAGDVLVHHPYDSFATSVQRFIEQAADDPAVLAIKQTLYRTSGDSPVVDALVKAAGSGKQVVVLVEIKARFDERNNIGWARVLEQAGCHVVYGVLGLKTHAKLCLVVREEAGGLRRYVHVGTGNYNPATARIYEDFGLISASPRLGADVSRLFNVLTGYAREKDYDGLIVAPREMRQRVISLIERETASVEAKRPARIVIKVNNLIDEAVVDALYRASSAGVRVDLIVRGICALRPGVPGMSDRIGVRSIVGRFLEHSRVFWFANQGDPTVLLGSADLMHRNLDRRVETLVTVESAEAKRQLEAVLALSLQDNAGSWDLAADGTWTRIAVPEADRVDLQAALMERRSLDAYRLETNGRRTERVARSA